MSVTIAAHALGTLATPCGERAGEVLCVKLPIVVKKGKTLAATVKTELGYLPAYHHIVGAKLVADALGTGVTANIGFMTGEAGSTDDARVVGTELYNGANVAAASVVEMTNPAAFRVTAIDRNRAIGVKFSADVVAPADNDRVATLLLFYTPSGD